MSTFQFLNGLKASPLMIHSSGYEALIASATSILNGLNIPEKQPIAISNTKGERLPETYSGNPYDKMDSGSIAIIPLHGVMFKHGSWRNYGVDEIARYIKLAYESENISAVLINGDSPGGYTDSVYLIEEVLRGKNKPTWMFVSGQLCSCALYVGSFCDKIYAINDMCTVGSLGVFAQLVYPTPGATTSYTIREIYPDESKLKNYPTREAIGGNDDPLKDELSVLAVHFQNIMKENRPGITDNNVFLGKDYRAINAVAIGLIDGVKTERDVIEDLAAETSHTTSAAYREEITRLFNE